MELRQFIAQALLDIVGAVEDAQKKTPLGTIVPSNSLKYEEIKMGLTTFQIIDFEVTVRADERAGSEAKLNVVAAIIGGSVKGDNAKGGGHAATLKFRIPVSLPTPDQENKEA
jgi:hypothetical protein